MASHGMSDHVPAGIEGAAPPPPVEATPEVVHPLIGDEPAIDEVVPPPVGATPTEAATPAATPSEPAEPTPTSATGNEPPSPTGGEVGSEGAPDEGKKDFPWAQFKRAERERDQLQARMAQLEADRAAEQARLDQLRQAISPQQTPQPWTPTSGRVPTPQELDTLRNEDPLEYSRVVAELARTQVEQVAQQQQAIQTQFMVRNQIDEFKRQHSDYEDAVRHLEQQEIKRWQATGLPDDQIPAMVQARAAMLVDLALRSGKSVPELAYAVAQADGWAPPSATPAPAPNGNGQTPQERVKASQAKTQATMASLGTVPSSGSTSRPGLPQTVDDIMALTEAEMDRLDREHPGWDKLA